MQRIRGTYSMSRSNCSRPASSTAAKGATTEASATIHESAVIREPIVLGPDCEIGPGAVVGPYVCLGDNATVGSNAVVERSVVDADTRIGAGATVVDCVTGVGVTIGNGTTILAAPEMSASAIVSSKTNTSVHCFADHVTDRGGNTYVPGAIVGSDAVVETGATVRGTIPERGRRYGPDVWHYRLHRNRESRQ